MPKTVVLEDWAKELIVDPLSKEPLSTDAARTYLLSPYGRHYPIVDGIYDLRLLNNNTTKDQQRWKAGQRFYEAWGTGLAARDAEQDYVSGIEGVRDVYADVPVEGTCLDVGGHQGRLRHFLEPGQRYISCDPFLRVFDDLEKQPNLTTAYPCLLEPINFVCCDAEFLPFRSSSFQTVHMRSVVDHFLNPELAINEAYRVLLPDAVLIVGLYVEGGRQGTRSVRDRLASPARNVLAAFGIGRFKDYHLWHPTYSQLVSLLLECGFGVDKVHWQKGFNEMVCYVRARKRAFLGRGDAPRRPSATP